MMAKDVTNLFRALGDETRQRLLQLLLHHELNVSELVQILGQPQSTISRHLKVLREAGMICDRRDGTNVLYQVIGFERNGDGSNIRGHIQEWMESRPMPRGLAGRLERTLRDRQTRSREYFARHGPRWDQIREAHFGKRFHLEAMISLLPVEWTVADVGCGTGYLLPVLGSCFRQVIAVDPVPEMLSAARTRPEMDGIENVSFHQGELESLPIADSAVDLALAVLVLHHVASPPRAIAELGRILRPGGKVLIVEQASHELQGFHERMQDRWWGFAAEELEARLSQEGFEDIRHRPLPLQDVSPANGMAVPELFVITARVAEHVESVWKPEID